MNNMNNPENTFSEIKKDIDKLVQEYITFTQEAMSKLKEHKQLIRNGILDPNKVNYLLAEHGSILNNLINERERYLILSEEYQEAFDKWYDQKYIEVRDNINKDRLASKLATKEEIRTEIKVSYQDEYYEYDSIVKEYKRKERYYEKLIKRWEGEIYTLRILSNNMIVEMKNLNFTYIKDPENNNSNDNNRSVRRRG